MVQVRGDGVVQYEVGQVRGGAVGQVRGVQVRVVQCEVMVWLTMSTVDRRPCPRWLTRCIAKAG